MCKRIHLQALGHAALSSQNKPQLLLHNKSFLSMSWGQLRHPLVHFSIIQLHSINMSPFAPHCGGFGFARRNGLDTIAVATSKEKWTNEELLWLLTPIVIWSSISSILLFHVWTCIINRQKRWTDSTVKENERQLCYYVAVTATLCLLLLGCVPGLAYCQPSGEPNDSFDPIRISAKSTLCSLRARISQLTMRPPSARLRRWPSVPTICARWMPDSPVCAQQRREKLVISQHIKKKEKATFIFI